MVWQCKARLGTARQGLVRLGCARLGMVRQGTVLLEIALLILLSKLFCIVGNIVLQNN